jgi:hypothetical protein
MAFRLRRRSRTIFDARDSTLAHDIRSERIT